MTQSKIQVISGTNRPKARSLDIAKIIVNLLNNHGNIAELLDLKEVPLAQLDGSQYSENQPQKLVELKDRINLSRGLIIVCPEYNGSFPGALKYFIDHWDYPRAFEGRAVAFVGLGGRFGGLRPVEHLQQVFGYRNANIFPKRVFLTNVWDVLKNGTITDTKINSLLEEQTDEFLDFLNALQK